MIVVKMKNAPYYVIQMKEKNIKIGSIKDALEFESQAEFEEKCEICGTVKKYGFEYDFEFIERK